MARKNCTVEKSNGFEVYNFGKRNICFPVIGETEESLH
jgi:hypothetical protein